VRTRDRVLACACVAMPLLYAAIAVKGISGGMGQGTLILIGVVLFLATYTVLDVMGHPKRPIPGEWLRRRITVNLIYLSAVGAVAVIVAHLFDK